MIDPYCTKGFLANHHVQLGISVADSMGAGSMLRCLGSSWICRRISKAKKNIMQPSKFTPGSLTRNLWQQMLLPHATCPTDSTHLKSLKNRRFKSSLSSCTMAVWSLSVWVERVVSGTSAWHSAAMNGELTQLLLQGIAARPARLLKKWIGSEIQPPAIYRKTWRVWSSRWSISRPSPIISCCSFGCVWSMISPY